MNRRRPCGTRHTVPSVFRRKRTDKFFVISAEDMCVQRSFRSAFWEVRTIEADAMADEIVVGDAASNIVLFPASSRPVPVRTVCGGQSRRSQFEVCAVSFESVRFADRRRNHDPRPNVRVSR